VSVHSLEEGIEADKRGADYILASHIFPTKCKEDLPPKGVGFIKDLAQHVTCKIVALGGINEKNYKEVIESGAHAIALMSYFFLNENLKHISWTK
jgi:thiamine-phosphate pyrophosphorylase